MITGTDFKILVASYAGKRDDYESVTATGGNNPKGEVQNYHIHNIPQEQPDILFDIYDEYKIKPHKIGVDKRDGKLSVWYKIKDTG